MTPKFNLRDPIPAIRKVYIAIKYKLAEITLKFNLRRSNSQKFPGQAFEFHISTRAFGNSGNGKLKWKTETEN